MRNLFNFWICILTFLCITTFILGQEDQGLRREITKIIKYDTELTDGRVFGFVLGVVDHDSTSISSFGSMFRDSVVKISDTTIFEIGGLTKIFIAHLCHHLASDDLLNLEASINNYLPHEYRNEILDDITCHHLISHTSGFPSVPDDLGQHQIDIDNPYANYTKEDLLHYYQSIKNPPALNQYIYSHINYALLEIIIENLTQTTLMDQLSKYIFIPYQMPNTFIQCAHCTLAPGYDRSKRLATAWSFASFAGSEGLKSTVKDLCSYIKMQLNHFSEDDVFGKLLTPTQKLPNAKKNVCSTRMAYISK